MGRNNYFQFKQFRIIQEKSAMKVGTDGVLLGSWVNVQNEKQILDIGTGTGLIALIMAQRTSAMITGVEIEKNAADEASSNAKSSLWNTRISIQNSSFQQYATTTDNRFDLIVSNPPFFENNQKSKDGNLAIARHNDLLPFREIIMGCLNILNETGRLALILPVTPAQSFISLAETQGLILNRITKVRPNNKKEIHRYLMEFSRTKLTLETEELAIHTDDGFDFTESYKALTKELYLKF